MPTPDSLTVVSWNLLCDVGPDSGVEPQAARVREHIRTESYLETLAGIRPDFVSLYEVNGSKTCNVGNDIADELGMCERSWTPYAGNDIGIFVATNREVRDRRIVTDTTTNRSTVITTVEDIELASGHLSSEPFAGRARLRQVRQMLGALSSMKAVALDDFNSFAWQKPRRQIEHAGFSSVVRAIAGDGPLPPTYPMPPYDTVYGRLPDQLLRAWHVSIDDIYFRGIKLVDRGLLRGASDHRAVWAEFSLAA